ncbi:MAG: ABC transporter ATP-binding protein [bacterium]|nr:ABC transporter ATP-binding protein [bacterium]
MNFIWKYLRRHKKLLVWSLVLAAINQIFSLLDPQIFRILVDRYASRVGEYSQHDFIIGVLWLLGGLVGVALVSRIAKNIQDYLVNVITQRLGTEMYSSSVAHSFSLPYSAFEDQRSGELLEKLQKAREHTQRLVESIINIVFLSLVGIVFVVGYAFIVHWMVGLVFFSIIPILSVVTYIISRGIKAAQKEVVQETTSLAGSTTETIRNVELVKSMGLEKQEVERLNSVNNTILKLELRKIILVRRLSFIQGTIINALRSALIFLMVWLIFQGDMTLGEMLSLFIYSFFVFTPLAEFGQVVTQYQEARASVDQLEDIMSMRPEPKADQPREIKTIETIEFDGVQFTHNGADTPALSEINFNVKVGETVAFVGPSGSGKTTIVKQMVGLYRPQAGAIRFNGIAGNELDWNLLRSRIGLVSQDTQLFSGTIKENLLFVNPRATDEECAAVMKAAAANSLLQRGANGLETKIGEGGMKISGGEKQRLAIARALLRKPDLIIFDEATSSLDSVTEKAITETVRSIVRSESNLITVLVAHRLSTVAHADRIYVLEKGKIIEKGNHQSLLETKGLYYALWRQQTATNEFIEDHRVRPIG